MTSKESPDLGPEGELRQRIENGSADAEDYRRLVDLLLATGRDDEAASTLERGLTLPLDNPTKANLCMELGWVYYSLNQLQRAATVARDAIALPSSESPTPRVAYCRASSQSILAHCLGWTDQDAQRATARLALDWLQPALADNTGLRRDEQAWVHIDAATLHALLDDPDESIAQCEKTLRLEPATKDRLSCLMVYADALRMRQRFREAKDCLTEAFRYAEGYSGLLPHLYMQQGLNEQAIGSPSDARQAFQRALEATERHRCLRHDRRFLAELWGYLASASYDLELYHDAAEAFEQALKHGGKHDGNRPSLLLGLGYSYAGLGKDLEARRAYRRVLGSRQSSEADREAASEALASLPSSSRRLRALMRNVFLYAQILWQHAVFFGFPTPPEYYRSRIGALYFALGEFRKALANFKESESVRHPSDTPLARYNIYYLGFTELNLDDYAKACRYFERYLSLNPNHARAKEALEWCRARLNTVSEERGEGRSSQ